MKKILIVSLILFSSFIVRGQNIKDLTYSPDVRKFVNNAGDFLMKDIYQVNKNKLSLSVIILTDVTSQEKIGYVEYTSQDSGQNTAKIITAALGEYSGDVSYFTSSLDAAELEKCITCLEYARENLLGRKPEGDPSYFFYDTRLGGRIGVKGTIALTTDAPKWVAFFNADPLERSEFERTFPLEGKAIDKIIDAFKKAQALIDSKVGSSPVRYNESNEVLILSGGNVDESGGNN